MCLSACGSEGSLPEHQTLSFKMSTITKSDYKCEQIYPAQMKGCQDIKLMPKIEGYLKEIYVKDGDKVKKGQLLFSIDKTDFQGAVASAKAGVYQAEASLGKAQQEFEGKKILNEKNVLSEFELTQSKRDVDVAKANLEYAKAQLEIAANALSFTEMRSPSDGVIGKINYRKGDLVGPNMQQCLTVVSDNHQMEVYFPLSENEAISILTKYKSINEAIKNIPELTLSLPGGVEYQHKGKVESISGIIDEQTGSVAVRAIFPNEEGFLLSGGSARIVMEKIYSNVIVIPQEATYDILDKIYVFKAIDGKAKSTIITVDKQNDGKNYVVTSGLEVGDTIVSEGASLLHDDDNLN